MKHEKILLILLLIVFVSGITGSILYTNRRIQSVLSQIENLHSTETISVQDTSGTDFDIGYPFAQFDDFFDIQEDLHNRVQTERIVPGQGSVSVVQQSVVIDGKKIFYTLLIESDRLSGTISIDDPLLKQEIITKFNEKTISVSELPDGTIEFMADPILLEFIQQILHYEQSTMEIFES